MARSLLIKTSKVGLLWPSLTRVALAAIFVPLGQSVLPLRQTHLSCAWAQTVAQSLTRSLISVFHAIRVNARSNRRAVETSCRQRRHAQKVISGVSWDGAWLLKSAHLDLLDW